MRIPLSWLRDFVDVPWGAKELGARLTMSGFELEALETAAPPFSGVVVAEIVEAAKHPQAEKLQVCKVRAARRRAAADRLRRRECARRSQDRAGHRRRQTTRRQGHHRGQAARRGVVRHVVLRRRSWVSRTASEGIIELPADAPVGTDLRAYMQLDDEILELNVTPNRGDAMSVLGIAREVAALTRGSLCNAAACRDHAGTLKDTFPVKLSGARGLPEARQPRRPRHRQQAASRPLWLRERLRRAGAAPHQPGGRRHAVRDARARPAHARLRPGQAQGRPGGAPGARRRKNHAARWQGNQTHDRCTRNRRRRGRRGHGGSHGWRAHACAAPTPSTCCSKPRSSRRPPSPAAAAAMAWSPMPASASSAAWILRTRSAPSSAPRGCCWRSPAARPVPCTSSQDPRPPADAALEVALRRERIARLLGTQHRRQRREGHARIAGHARACRRDRLAGDAAFASLRHHDRSRSHRRAGAHRRLRGHRRGRRRRGCRKCGRSPKQAPVEPQALEILATRGYQEAITYAFVDPALQDKLFPGHRDSGARNPIASDMAVMRASLWPGLIKAALENQRRQQDRIRLFEHGARFDGGHRDRPHRRHRHGLAPAGAVGRACHAGGFLRREAGSRGAVRAHRRSG